MNLREKLLIERTFTVRKDNDPLFVCSFVYKNELLLVLYNKAFRSIEFLNSEIKEDDIGSLLVVLEEILSKELEASDVI